MRDLFGVYATQASLLWEWRGGPASLVKRGILTFIVATISFTVTAAVVPGIEISSIGGCSAGGHPRRACSTRWCGRSCSRSWRHGR